MQGEQDATDLTWANNYETALGEFFDGVQAYVDGRYSDLGWTVPGKFKKIIGRINGIDDVTMVYRGTVRTAQANYCNNLSNNAILIDTDSYPLKDDVHYSATGQIQFGIDIFNAL